MLENLAYVGEIVAAIAVILTLIYVAAQLKLNTASNGANAYQTWLAANLQVNASAAVEAMSETLAAGHEDSANLTEGSSIKFGLFQMGFFQLVQSVDYLYRTGSLDHALWQSEVNRAALNLRLPGVRQWWDAGGKTQLTPEFVRLIESTESTAMLWNWEKGKGFVVPEDSAER